MIYAPIWKDTYYTTNEISLVYTINTDGNQIFSGKAYKMPSAERLSININKICQNYLSNDIRTLLEGSASSLVQSDVVRDFELRNEAGTVLETYRFIYCWDYDWNWSGSNVDLSNKINGHYDPRMYKLKTIYNNGTATTYKNSGYYHTEVCADYAVYYVNARGGWDAFAIEGTVKKTDNITQYTTDRAFNNTTLEFENDRYISEIQTSYELNTGWLADYQAETLAHNLLGSNKAYLHNLETGKLVPIVITDNTAEYQTYQTNGGKLARYTIKVKESQSKIRK